MRAREGHDCPICGVIDDRLPDAYGVYTCRRCNIEFRPPQRLPVRGATVSKLDDMSQGSDKIPWGVVVVVAVVLGAIVSVIKGPNTPRTPYVVPPTIELPEFQPVAIDPAMFDAIGPTTVTLEHELHAELLERDSEDVLRLHLTGRIRNPEQFLRLAHVQVDVYLLDADRQPLGVEQAVVACPQLEGREACAWVLDASVTDDVAHWLVEATGTRGRVEPYPQISELGRFDAEGQPLTDSDLRLDVDEQTLTFPNVLPSDVLDTWAGVTALDERGQVVDVALTRWQLVGLDAGSHTRPITLPGRAAVSYEVRVRGVGSF